MAQAGPSREPPRSVTPRPSRMFGTMRQNNDLLASKISPFTTHTPLETQSNNTYDFPTTRNWETSQIVQAAVAGAIKKPIGIIYLAASPLSPSPPGQVGELNLGIILNTAYRGKGYAREAIHLVIKHAFDDRHCHRIQASLLSLSSKDRMISLLTQLRFGHEGTKRRAFFNPLIGEWQDVTTLAMLDTDWAMRGFYKPAPKSLWDELFMRHERERDELLRWEEDQNRLNRKRTASTETLRAVPLAPDPDSDACSDAGSDAGSVASRSSSISKGKKRAAPSDWSRDPYDGSSSDAESEFDFVRKRYIQDIQESNSRLSGTSSPTPSDISLESTPYSISVAGSPPATPSAGGFESDWDLMSSSSSSSSSFGDDD